MSDMININPQFDIDNNFWDFNPQLKIVKPFSILYNRDKSKDKEKSSKEMWCVFFMADSSPIKNKLYRIPEEDRKKELKTEYYKDINFEDKDIQECIKQYPEKTMSTIEKTFKVWEDVLQQRNEFLATTTYNATTFEVLEKILQNSKKITDAYDDAKKALLSEDIKLKGRGNRTLSKSEKGLI